MFHAVYVRTMNDVNFEVKCSLQVFHGPIEWLICAHQLCPSTHSSTIDPPTDRTSRLWHFVHLLSSFLFQIPRECRKCAVVAAVAPNDTRNRYSFLCTAHHETFSSLASGCVCLICTTSVDVVAFNVYSFVWIESREHETQLMTKLVTFSRAFHSPVAILDVSMYCTGTGSCVERVTHTLACSISAFVSVPYLMCNSCFLKAKSRKTTQTIGAVCGICRRQGKRTHIKQWENAISSVPRCFHLLYSRQIVFLMLFLLRCQLSGVFFLWHIKSCFIH